MLTQKTLGRLWQLAVVVILLVLAFVYYNYRDFFQPQAGIRLSADPACDLRSGACELVLPGGGSISFSIDPRTIPVMQPLQVEVRIVGFDADAVEVDFTGVDMNMGFNRYHIPRLDAGYFRGEAILPVCVRNRMEWQALVMLKNKSGSISAPFLFYTLK